LTGRPNARPHRRHDLLEELCLHEIPAGLQHRAGTVNADPCRPGRRENDEGMAIGHGAPILDHIRLPLPQIMALISAMMGLEIAQPMRRPVAVMWTACLQKGVGMVEDKARGTHKMARVAVIDRAVIEKMMEESTFRVERRRLVKGQNALDMRPQESRGFEVGSVGSVVSFHFSLPVAP